MIPIEIENMDKFNKVGNEVVDLLHRYINEVATSGTYTIKKKVGKKFEKVSLRVNSKTKNFFRRINKKTTIKDLVFIPPHKLEVIVRWVSRKVTDKDVLQDIKNIFVDIVYSKKFNKQKLIDAIGLKTCPYCNRSYIYTITGGKINPQLDHFYPKSKYPLFAVSLYNLIPSCAICNSAGGKGNKDTLINSKYQIISPYLIKHEDFRFSYKLLSPEIIKGNNSCEQVEIFLKHCACKANAEVLHLNSLYRKHGDHIVDLLYKRKYVYTDDYLKFLFQIIGNRINKSIINRFIVGAYVETENYQKRPLSKMYAEIAKEIGLINDVTK